MRFLYSDPGCGAVSNSLTIKRTERSNGTAPQGTSMAAELTSSLTKAWTEETTSPYSEADTYTTPHAYGNVTTAATVMTLVGGKCLVMYNRYVYCTHCKLKLGDRWRCNQYILNGCKAHLVLDQALNVIKAVEIHDHAPPMYLRGKDGFYMKI
ncbi:unnamed protein product [Chrysodeixis includens]|uniref:FLYWCH-type domain-containing protein n=1 Tax=Chrysodeixis includens TaxID=689277 RepID=A0A9P0BHV0_CHRIL|nr:unnamed protein product [Chrysodeixis includens]